MPRSVEGTLLRNLTRAFCSASPQPVVPPQDVDWYRFITLGLEHEVAASLFPLIERQALPEQVGRALDDAVDQCRRRSTLLLLELERILPALADAGCEPVLLKGVPLALTVYEQPGQRFFRDIDILVARDRVQDTCAVLAEYGYQLKPSELDLRWYRDYHFHWILQNRLGTIIEVHWALTLKESTYRTDLNRVVENAAPVQVGKAQARRPRAQDILLHMVLQAISVGYSSQKHIIDAALLIGEIEDWEQLVRSARDYNLGTGLWFLLRMVDEIADVAAPEEVMTALEPDRLSRSAWQRLRQSELCLDRLVARSYPHHFLLQWLCAPNNRLRLREIQRYLFPGEGGLLEAGFTTENWPGSWRRIAVSLGRIKDVLGAMRSLVSLAA